MMTELNWLAQNLAQTWLAYSVVLAVQIALVLLLRKPVRRWLGAVACYRLWLLPLLCLPFFIGGPALIGKLASLELSEQHAESESATALQQLIAFDFQLLPFDAVTQEEFLSSNPGAAEGTATVSGWLIFALASGFVTFALIAWQTSRWLDFSRQVRALAVPLHASERKQCGTAMHFDASIPVFSLQGMGSAALFGVVKPVLLLPESFCRRYGSDQRHVILAHEAVHLRRGDNVWNLCALLVMALFWTNPLLLLAWRYYRLDQELSCDALALARCNREQQKSYARTLLTSMTNLPPHTNQPGLSAWNNLRDIKERSLMVKQHLHSATRPFATLFSLLTLAVLGASLTVVCAELLSPVAQAAESARRTQAEQQIRQDAEQQAQQARQEAEQLAQQARQEAEQQARQARQEAEQQAQQARQEAEQQARQARQETEQRAQQTTQRVRQAEQQALQVETLSRQVDQQALQVEQQAIRIAQHEQQVESEARQVESEARQVEQQAEQLAQVSGQVAQQAQEVERQVQQLTQLAQPTRPSREQAQQLVQVPEQRAQAARAERRVRTQGWPGSSRARAPEEAATAAIDVVTGGVLADAIEFLNMKQFAEARERLGDLQPNRLSPFEQSRYYQLMFNIEMNDENYLVAREQLELAIATGGLNAQESSRVRYQLAQLYVQEEKYAEASAALEEWIAAEPAPNSAAYYLLAASYNYQDLVERALPHAQRAVDLADGSPIEAWLGLLFALNIKLERLDAAEDTAAEMVKLFPDNVTYRTQLEQLKAQNARR